MLLAQLNSDGGDVMRCQSEVEGGDRTPKIVEGWGECGVSVSCAEKTRQSGVTLGWRQTRTRLETDSRECGGRRADIPDDQK